MRVLIACEFSGAVRDAFRRRGHDAWSCDLLPTEVDGPHIQDDVLKHLGNSWDLLVAFPPCTFLAASGARWFEQRKDQQQQALDFVLALLQAPIPKIALENPIGVISTRIRKPDQIVHPWQFGHGETKATCLWLKGLPKLRATNIVNGRVPRVHHMAPGPNRSRERSRTYFGIAEAMAEQWSLKMPASSQQNQNRWNTSLRVNVAPRQRGSFFRPKNGENLIRVLNFTHKVTKGDIQLGRYEADTPVGSMMDEFFIPMRQHFRGKGQRPTPCGRLYKVDGTYDGTCVLCDQADDLRASALDADQKAADRIRPSNKYPMNIVNLSAPEQQIMVWEAPYALLAFIQTSRDSTAYKNQELLGMQGRDILITYREGDNIPPNERYKFLWMDRDQAKKIHAKGEVVDLYGSPDYVPPQFQGLVTATPSKAQEAPAPSKGAAAAVTSPKPGKGSVEPQEMQEEIVPEETPAPPVKRGPGRPAKKKVEPTVAIRYRVGSKVKFIGEDDDGQPTELDGEIVADKNDDGQWSVLAGDTEYGVMEEEFIK